MLSRCQECSCSQREVDCGGACTFSTHSAVQQGNLGLLESWRPINLTLMFFGLWEEAGVPGENPRIHGENMHTPSRKNPRPGVVVRTFLMQGNSTTNCASMQPHEEIIL
ncbi:hypothetical protein ILYODFUR_016136 [Ilyodon furcidens]|uniref:Uncharacterized protein n=1 Tax=Ilyodon furcidens TaxID=33524 RepID=A0ABV0UUP7_9TELE